MNLLISEDLKCGTNESIAIGNKGMIRSPNYPNQFGYTNKCEWKITAPVGYKIKLEFLYLQVRFYVVQYLHIF